MGKELGRSMSRSGAGGMAGSSAWVSKWEHGLCKWLGYWAWVPVVTCSCADAWEIRQATYHARGHVREEGKRPFLHELVGETDQADSAWHSHGGES